MPLPFAAHVANIAAGIVAGFDIERDSPEVDLYDVAKLGPTWFAHGLASLVIMMAA
jgi:hypothetical protein